MTTYSAAAVANVFLQLARDEGKKLTNMKVQKLVYFAHGVHLAGFDTALVHDHPRAWTFGPVIPPLYEELRKYGADTVTEDLQAIDEVDSPSAMKAIEATWKAYKDYTAAQLSKISHIKGGPWDLVWNDPDGNRRFDVIPDPLIKDYYLNRVEKKRAAATA